nr:pre-mrna-splicing factor syf2 [Quercus suber]
MAPTRKRKGSLTLDTEGADSSKRRFTEFNGELHEPGTSETIDSNITTNPAATATSLSSPPVAETAPVQDRAARFAALRARNLASRKSNLADTKNEARRQSTDPSQLIALNRKRDIAQHKLLKVEAEEGGEDFERKRAWDWTIEESERWDKKVAQKQRARDGVAFQDYSQEAGKVYARQVGELEKAGFNERKEAYLKEKNEAIDRAVRSGGLEIVETEDGELVAVDKDGSYLSTGSSATFTETKPDRAAVDRLVADIKKSEEVRRKKRRDRGINDDDGGDVTYINEKNKQFNMKLARFYNKYTADIRESFERGTAI